MAAKKIADDLPKQDSKRNILLFAAPEVPNFQALISYRAQITLICKAFTYAELASKKADEEALKPPVLRPPAPPVAIVPPVAAAGLALDAVNKLLGFFRTDYTVGSFESDD